VAVPSKPAWIVTVSYIIRASSPEAALEVAKQIVKDPAAPVSNIALGETTIFESEPTDYSF
jgi:hypothetical protein